MAEPASPERSSEIEISTASGTMYGMYHMVSTVVNLNYRSKTITSQR